MKGWFIYRAKLIFKDLVDVITFLTSRILYSPFFTFVISFISLISLSVILVLSYSYKEAFASLFSILILVIIVSWFFKVSSNSLKPFLVAIFIVLIRLALSYFSVNQITTNYDALILNNDDLVNLNVVIVKPPDVNNDYVKYFIKNDSDNLLLSIKASRYPVYIPYSKCKLVGRLAKLKKSDPSFQYYYSKGVFYSVRINSFSCVDDKSNILWNLYSFKHSTFKIIEQNMDEPYASLLIGIIWGENRSFSPEMESAFKITGTTHVIAASGYNVNVIANILNLLLYYISRRFKIVISITFLFLYLFLTGVSGSIFRAVLMYVINRVYELFGYPLTIIHIIFMTVVLILLFNPGFIYDIGFLLSLGATLGLLVYSGFLSEKFKIIPNNVVSTISSNIGTLAMTVSNFKVISLLSIPINSTVLIFLDNIMELGLVGITFFYLNKTLAKWIFILIQLLMQPFIFISYSCIKMNWTFVNLDRSQIYLFLSALGLISAVIIIKVLTAMMNKLIK